MSIHDFENKIINNKLEILNNLKINTEYYKIQQHNEIERNFIKLITILMILLLFFWII